MIKFNPENKDTLTFGEALDPAMKITDPQEAQQYLTDYVAYIQRHLDQNPRNDTVTAEQIAKSNLGYYAGYYSHKTRIRVEQLFDCVHPIFGKAREHKPSAKEAFQLGVKEVKNRE